MFIAVSRQQQGSHARSWGLIALFFTLLVILRLFDLEELWRTELRDWSRASETYGDRKGIQLPLTIGIVVIAGIAAFAWVVRSMRMAQGRRNIALAAAQLGALAMFILIVLRMISFSTLDKILYGPAKLNWVGDLGATALVAGCAIFYVVVVRSPPRGRSQR